MYQGVRDSQRNNIYENVKKYIFCMQQSLKQLAQNGFNTLKHSSTHVPPAVTINDFCVC
jgi:hypothetical protein